MNILHICTYYIGSKVYKELFSALGKINGEIKQEVYIPVKSYKSIGKNKIEINNIKLFYRKIYNFLDKILFSVKIFKAFEDIQKEIDIKAISLIHAHTIFADGMLAYKLNKKYGIGYIATVRNSDIYAYLKYMPFSRRYLSKIIRNAKKIIFISPLMKKDLEKKMKKKDRLILNKKFVIMPNGISDFWHNNVNKYKELDENNCLKFIQVSSLDKNKNLYTTFNIINKMNQFGINSKLTVIGSRQL